MPDHEPRVGQPDSLQAMSRDCEDFRVGLLCATMANLQRDPKTKPQPFRPEDFMPGERKQQKQGYTRDEWVAWARSMAAR